MVDVAVFASGNGSNFENLVSAQKEDNLSYNIKILIADKDNIGALHRAQKLGVSSYIINPKTFSSKKEYENELIHILKNEGISLIALAGYMRIIGPTLLNAYEGNIINIHPAFLPEFPGKSGIEDAFQAGVSESGVTIHYVDSGIDTGNIIYQERVKIESHWTLDELRENIHRVEHSLYPMVLDRICKKIL